MITLPAVALSPGSSSTVQIPISELGGPVGAFKVSNESPYPLTISWAGNSKTVAPWTADVFPAPGVQTFTIAVAAGTVFSGAQALIDVAGQGEGFPGSYPLSLPGQTSISGGTIEIGTISGPVTIGGNVPVENAPGTQLSTVQLQGQGVPFTIGPGGTSGSSSSPINVPGSGALAVVIKSINPVAGNILALGNNSNQQIINEHFQTLSSPLSTSTSATVWGVITTPADTAVTVAVALDASVTTPVVFTPIFLPPGLVNVAQIINAPANPANISNPKPSPWQSPSDSVAGFGTAGATILPALPAPGFYRIHTINIFLTGTAAATFNVTVTGKPNLVQLNGTPPQLTIVDRKGLPLPVGAVVGSSGTGGAQWVIDYAVDA